MNITKTEQPLTRGEQLQVEMLSQTYKQPYSECLELYITIKKHNEVKK